MNVVNEDIITKILTSDDPSRPIKIIEWDVDNKIIKAGNNYASEVCRLTVDYERNGVKLKKKFFLKVPCNSPTYEALKKYGAYEKETIMYANVFPQMYAIEEEYFTARYYLFDEKSSLFLKDLSLSGYKTGDRIKQLDVEQCYFALRSLAKYHALSVKLNENGQLPQEVKHDPFYHRENQEIEVQKSFLSGVDMFIENLQPHIRQKYSKEIENFKSITTWDAILDAIIPSSDSFGVLLHGDFWTNNIMFKYDKYGIVKKAKIIDFQLSRWGRPAIDLIYFFITSMRYELYSKYYHLFLSVYLDTLNKVLTTLNCRTYKMEDLVRDLESADIYGCVVFSCVLPFIIADPDDPIDLDEMHKDNTFNMNSAAKVYKRKFYIDIATKWFVHYAEKALFDEKKDKSDLVK